MMEFYLFALLPLGLLSLFDKGRHRHTAGFGFLAALAPVIAKGIGSLISHKQQSNQAKTLEAQRKQEALAADEQAKRDWETTQNSAANQSARFKNTFSLGKLAGHLGGMDKVPKSIAAYYNSLRTMPQYTGTSSYREPVKSSGGGWNLAAGITDALGYFDPSAMKGKAPMSSGQPTGQVLSSNVMPGSSRNDIFDTGQIKKYQMGPA